MRYTDGMSKPKSSVVAVLDIGSSKVVCLIAKVDDQGKARIAGIGHQLSQGIKAGAIADVGQAEQSIVAAVHAAEQMAGETIERVVANVSCGAPSSLRVHVEVPLPGGAVTVRDLRKVIDQGRSGFRQEDRHVIDVIPVNYTLDQESGIIDPRGMFGSRLSANLHVVTVGATALRNLAASVARCHLEPVGFVESSYAAGQACLADDEKELGACIIDMGGGVTKFSVFFEGRCVYTDSVPVGGIHVTSDIAKGLSTSIAAAERIKTLHGSVISSIADSRDLIDVPRMTGDDSDENENQSVPRLALIGIVRPRMEEIFEMVRGKLESSGFDKVAGKRLVLTGGASQLLGLRDFASQMLSKQARLARPKTFEGLAESTSGPAFATVVGLLEGALAGRRGGAVSAAPAGGLFKKALVWVKENF
ncbi:MAG: cell division protein FtsA [Alphaproteobacteria bacterium]|nr:cell division protein FtsA [Alphaproteobacteria bacterium]